jgi:phosphoserine phosphatase
MSWWQIEPLAKAGAAVRRRSWLTSTTTSGWTILYVSGAGTERAVAVRRAAGVDVIVTNEIFSSVDFLADDWEVVT